MMGQKRIKHRPGDIVNKGDLQAVMKNISSPYSYLSAL